MYVLHVYLKTKHAEYAIQYESCLLSIEIKKDVRCMILYWIETLKVFLETTTTLIPQTRHIYI